MKRFFSQCSVIRQAYVILDNNFRKETSKIALIESKIVN